MIEYENVNPETEKFVRVRKRNMLFAIDLYHKFFLSKWKEVRFSLEKESVKKYCLVVSKAAWTDLNKDYTVLTLPDKCPKSRCNCQKQFFLLFTFEQYELESSGFRSKMKKIFKRAEKMWNISFKPGLKIPTPIFSAAVAAKTRSPQAAQTTSNILKSISAGKTLSLTDMHGNRIRLKVM